MHLRISSSLPITGSSFPALAIAVRSFPYFSSDSYFPSGSARMINKIFEKWKRLTGYIADEHVLGK